MVSIHATSVYIDGKAVLIMGKSGAGKSMLALELIEQGALLIADDVTFLSQDNGRLYATASDETRGCIEARGIGILSGLPTCQHVPVGYIVRLTDDYPPRLPENQEYMTLCEMQVPVFDFCKNEKYLPTLVKIAGKIISKNVLSSGITRKG